MILDKGAISPTGSLKYNAEDKYKKTHHIHTIISDQAHKKLLVYGKGRLNEGINNLLNIADQKTVEVTITTKVEI